MAQPQSKTIYEILGRRAVHPFPARMAPGIALEVLAKSERSLRVLDPMSGSGTVLAVARSKGHHAYGLDIDPLAVLISKVWITTVSASRVNAKAAEVIGRARRRFRGLSTGNAYPDGADNETRKFVRYWFDDYARRQLAALSRTIKAVRDDNVRDVLWCAFSRLIISKQAGASLAMDLSHSRPHKTFTRAPVKPFDGFISAVNKVVDNCIECGDRSKGPIARMREGDARKLPLADETMDLVITSPPYLNAIDYLRCSKFSLVWMGYSIGTLRCLRSGSIGSEVATGASDRVDVMEILSQLNLGDGLSARHEGRLRRYINDLRRSIAEVSRVLTAGGRAVYVVGENTIDGTFIPNADILVAVAQLMGMTLTAKRARKLPANRRYLPPPSSNSNAACLDLRMRREVILSFVKGNEAAGNALVTC